MLLRFAGGPTVSVEGASAGVETWLGEYFAAALTDRPVDEVSGRVVIVHSAEERRRLRATRPADARPVPLFAVEREMLARDGWEHEGTVVADYEDRGYVLVIDDRSTTVVLDPDESRPRFMVALILYELVALEMRRSWLELHAASVVVDGRAHLLLGDKGAGKTTLALALARTGAGVLANDRAFAQPDRVVGMPTPVKVLPDTLAHLPELTREPTPVEPFMLTAAELRAASSDHPAGEPLMFPPAEPARRLGAPVVAGEHPLGTLVFPEVVPGLDGIESVPLTADDAERRLLANLYRAALADREPTVYERLAGGRPRVPAELAAGIASARPAHRLRLGAAALADPRLAEAVVEVVGCP